VVFSASGRRRGSSQITLGFLVRPCYSCSGVGRRDGHSVCRSDSLSVTPVSPAKTAATIKMPFGEQNRVGCTCRNHTAILESFGELIRHQPKLKGTKNYFGHSRSLEQHADGHV